MEEKISVCIVEDSVTFSDWLKSDLDVFDEVEVTGRADTVNSAIQLIQDNRPDVVVLDLWLNEGTGFELLEAVGRMENRPAIFVFTNYPWPTLNQKCHDMGAAGFFEKSGEYFNLIDSIRTFRKGA